ncbi:MAG TPA: PAS-domain containing protein [Kiloniellales bacterium]|nr:PAS-domain containing protein [Kiloniellales bacterium]
MDSSGTVLLIVVLAALAVGLAIALTVTGLRARRRLAEADTATAAARKRAERAEVRLEGAPFASLVLDEDDPPLTGSTQVIGSLGLGAETEPTLSDLLAVGDAEDSAALRSALTRLRKEGWGFETRLRRADGEASFAIAGRRLERPDRAPLNLVWLRDASAESQAARAAAARLERLEGALDALPLPVWRREPDLSLSYCNRAYAEAVGAAPEAVLEDGIELLGKAKRAAARELARRALETGEAQSAPHHVVVAGARRLLAVTEQPLPGGGLIGHAVDRTDVEELQAELSRHISAHADVLENLGSAIAIFGPDMRLKFFNTAYARLWHLEESFLETEPQLGDILEALREARRLPEQANFPEYKRERQRRLQTLIEPLEELVHLPDGSTLRSVAVPHPFGGVLLTHEDVTDRLSLERSYNTLIEVQRETLDNLYEGVAVYGADGRLKLSNPAFARIWNLPEELLSGQPHVRDLVDQTRPFFDVSDEEWERILATRVARATDPEPRSGRRVRADGSVIDWALVPLPDGASLFTFVDVTDSTRVERMLRERNEALETADRLKSEFVANISYELRTPLNAIVGFAEILENQFFGTLNERQLEYSRGIVESSQRLTSLINDILDLATIEAGYLQLELGPVEVHVLLESVRTLSHERAHNRSIELVTDCAEDIGEVIADGRRLKQALFNLLSNAFKYTAPGGRVSLAARRDDAELRLTVEDNGVGIPPEDLDRVFGKFERVSGQATPGQGAQGGAGLGLSLVKSLIELHGGRVELDSAPGEGTRVICHIPLRPAEQAQPWLRVAGS